MKSVHMLDLDNSFITARLPNTMRVSGLLLDVIRNRDVRGANHCPVSWRGSPAGELIFGIYLPPPTMDRGTRVRWALVTSLIRQLRTREAHKLKTKEFIHKAEELERQLPRDDELYHDDAANAFVTQFTFAVRTLLPHLSASRLEGVAQAAQALFRSCCAPLPSE